MDPREWPVDEENLAAFGNDHVRNLTDHSVVIYDSNGVQEDNRSDEFDCQLIALGLLFYRWVHIGSSLAVMSTTWTSVLMC